MLRSRIHATVSALNNGEEEIKRLLFYEDVVLANGSKLHCQICTCIRCYIIPFCPVHGANVCSLRGLSSHFPLDQVILCQNFLRADSLLPFQVSRTPSSLCPALKLDIFVMKTLNPFSGTALYYYHHKFRRHSKSSTTCTLKSCFAPQFHSKRRRGTHHEVLNKAMASLR